MIDDQANSMDIKAVTDIIYLKDLFDLSVYHACFHLFFNA